MVVGGWEVLDLPPILFIRFELFKFISFEKFCPYIIQKFYFIKSPSI